MFSGCGVSFQHLLKPFTNLLKRAPHPPFLLGPVDWAPCLCVVGTMLELWTFRCSSYYYLGKLLLGNNYLFLRDFCAYKDGSNISTKTLLNHLKPHQNPTKMSPKCSPIWGLLWVLIWSQSEYVWPHLKRSKVPTYRNPYNLPRTICFKTFAAPTASKPFVLGKL